MGLYDDYSQGALSMPPAVPNGGAAIPPALAPYLQPPRNSLLNDPTTAALLSVAGGLLSAGAPSPVPMSIGGALGGALTQGVNAYGAAQKNNMQNALAQAHLGLYAQQAKKAELDNQLTQGLLNGGIGGGMNADQLEAYGQRLAAAGHAGGATFLDAARRMREREQNAAAVRTFQSAPGMLGAGVTTGSPQGQALLGNLTGDPAFDRDVLAAQNEALNSNARPQMPASPVVAANPGLFGSLANSPFVGPQAQAMQRQIDTAPAASLTPANILTQYTHLSQQHQSGQNQQDNRDLRRDISDQVQAVRQSVADAARTGQQGNRDIANEDRLSAQYNSNPTIKQIQATKPVITSAANYMAGKKYDSSGDRALAFAFAKVLDPNDRVAVSDVRDIQKLGNLPERVVQGLQSLAEGKMLPERVRLDMWNVIADKYKALNEQAASVEDEFRDRAKRRMLNPDNVVIPYAHRRSNAGGSAGGSGGSNVVDFSKLPRGR